MYSVCTRMYECVCVCVCVCMCVYECVCVCVCTLHCMCVYMLGYVYMYMYISSILHVDSLIVKVHAVLPQNPHPHIDTHLQPAPQSLPPSAEGASAPRHAHPHLQPTPCEL